MSIFLLKWIAINSVGFDQQVQADITFAKHIKVNLGVKAS